MEKLSIYYDDNTNLFIDDYGNEEDSVVDIMSAKDMVFYKRVGGTYYRTHGDIIYEIDFPIRDNKRSLQYDSETNIMYDEDGYIVFNIFSIIDPNTLYLFKKGKKSNTVTTIAGGFAGIMWLEY
jgi:hypothetical protein